MFKLLFEQGTLKTYRNKSKEKLERCIFSHLKLDINLTVQIKINTTALQIEHIVLFQN